MNLPKSLAIFAGFALFASACTTTDKPATADTSAAVTSPPSSTDAATTDTAAPTPDSSPASTTPGNLVVNVRGIGPIAAGMTLDEANAATGNALIIPATLQECDFVRMKNGPEGLMFMVEQRKISRVDVQSGTIATTTGAKIGDSEDRIRSLYPGQVTVQPHKYDEGGRYLIVTPGTAADKDYRIIFETNGKTVQRFRSGKLPAVQYVEGCS